MFCTPTPTSLSMAIPPELVGRRFPKGSLNRSFHRPSVFSSSYYSVSPRMKIQFIPSQYNTLKLPASSDSFRTFYRFSPLNDHDEEDAENCSFDEAVELFNKREYYREELFQIVDKTRTSFLIPDNSKGLSPGSMFLAMIGNGLMITRALLTCDFMWTFNSSVEILKSISSSSFMFKQGQQLRSSNSSDEVVSANGVFKLGFYHPGSYLSIWYRNIEKNPEVIWLGNRYPIPDPSAVFTLDFDGKLKIISKKGQLIVLNPMQNVNSGNNVTVTATLMDSGNFVLNEVLANGIVGKVLWQSFDYPINTLLPGMKLGKNFETGQSWTLSSWLSWLVLTPGAFRLGVDPGGTNQLVLWKREDVYWTSGVWKNGSFQNAPELTRRADLFEFSFVSNEEEKYFSYKARNSSIVSRLEVNFWGQIVQYVLAKDGTSWENTTLVSLCKHGKNFPNLVECVEHKPSTCSSNSSEIFVPIRSYANSTKSSYMDYNTNISLIDCQATCWKNCSCIGCVTLHQNGTGCFYMSNISDVLLDERSGFGFYLESRFTTDKNDDLGGCLGGTTIVGGTKRDSKGGKKKIRWILWCIIAATVGLTILFFGYLIYRRRRKLRLLQQTDSSQGEAFLQLRCHAWDLWKKEESIDLVDESVDRSYPEEEFTKCVHIGLLCVQEHATDRPTMSDVISMLSNDVRSLPQPKQPAYCHSGKSAGSPSSGTDWISRSASINNVTITVLEPR
ncbi:hypothetical protein F8388_012801 [Cannabis sativa]|uniref:Bulb-type lectin domain-containing protein n=1 Tax=Cannabis sativa TaxID=3483 RepID=A0A7J6F490_CANSA|nr:hypothetical protein F8388_012801 [Cannabis sativa]